MIHEPLTVLPADPTSTVVAANLLAYVLVAVSSAVFAAYLARYVHHVLAAETFEWWYLAVVGGAGIIYGGSRIAWTLTGADWLVTFGNGAVLFFVLFLGLGLRALYHAEHPADDHARPLPKWVDYLVIAAFVAAWWLGFLFEAEWIRLVVAGGWILASAWAVLYGVQTVRVHEGTTLAAITRHLLPAIVIVVAIVVGDLVGGILGLASAYLDAVWLVGTVLVAAFLFNTAVAIRQESGEVERMYDWTTWRQQTLDGEPGE